MNKILRIEHHFPRDEWEHLRRFFSEAGIRAILRNRGLDALEKELKEREKAQHRYFTESEGISK